MCAKVASLSCNERDFRAVEDYENEGFPQRVYAD